MPADLRSLRSVPVGACLLFVVAFGLYIAMLASIVTPAEAGGGEAVIGAAFQELFITAGLWIALAVLLLVGGMRGEMPRWAAIAGIFLHPLSGVATFIALDMCSRSIGWAITFPVLLPALMALYAMWARLPQLHGVLPANTTSATIWCATLILSIAPLVLANYY
jgi:hypothetical protein